MLSAVIKKELVQHLLSFRFLLGTTLVVMLTIVATLLGIENFQLRLKRYEASVQQQEADLQQIHVYSYLQPVLARQPEPLSILSRGLEGRLGSEVEIHLHEEPFRADGELLGNPFMAFIAGS